MYIYTDTLDLLYNDTALPSSFHYRARDKSSRISVPPPFVSEGTRAPMVISRVYDTLSLFRGGAWSGWEPNRRGRIEKKRLHGAYRCLRGEINGGDGAAAAAIGVRLFRITLPV